MPPSSSASRPPRTWTGNDSGSSGKWIFVFWLALGLIIALALFIWWMLLPNAAQVYYVSLAVDDYGDVLPKPHYAVWPVAEIQQHQKKNDLIPWKEVKGKGGGADGAELTPSVQGTAQLTEWLEDLRPALIQQGIESRDTLIVQLRMHAIASVDDDSKYKIQLLTGERSETDGRFNFRDLITALSSLPVQNVVLLADVCDLDYAPQVNVAVNPIASAFQSICETEKPRNGQNIWILCAARDYEHNHVSHLRKRTLLQSASEYALARSSNDTADTRDNKISLAEFYDQVWRYCRRATRSPSGGDSDGISSQTPVLLRLGEREFCKPNTPRSPAWSLAQNVTMVRAGRPKSEPKPSEDSKPEETVKKDEKKTPEDETTKKDINDDPVLSYWSQRNELISSRTQWPPALFAPHLWAAHQRLFTLQQFALPASQNRVDNLVQELKQLQAAIQQPSRANQAANNQYLLMAFQSFQDNRQLAPIRAPWENVQLLPLADQSRWSPLREMYRTYAQSCSSISDWAHWSRHHFDDMPHYSSFIEGLIALRRALPTNGRAALDQSVPFQTSSIEQAYANLRTSFQKLSNPLRAKMKAGEKLTWQDELRLQQLLESPLLDDDNRRPLWDAWSKLQSSPQKLVDEPDRNGQVDRAEPLDVGPSQFPQDLNIWFDTTSELRQLVNAELSTGSMSDPATRTKWCEQFKEAVEKASPSQAGAQETELHRWHTKCLATLFQSRTDPTAAAGIVLPASVSRALRVAVVDALPATGTTSEPGVAFRNEQQTRLILSIQRADGSEVDAVRISWKPISPLPWDRNQLTVATLDDVPQPPETPTSLSVQNRTLNLKLRTEVDSRQFTAPMSIELLVSEGLNSEPVRTRVNVFPRQPDVVELKVYRRDETKELPEETPGNYPKLKVLAIQGAKSRFEFKLNNLSSQAKRCIVNLYAMHDSDVAREAGRPIVVPSKLEGRAALAKSAPLDLPSAIVGRDQPQSLTLKLEPAPADGTALGSNKNGSANVQWLYFQIQELGADDKPLKDKVHSAYALLEARPPDNDIITIKRVPGPEFHLSIATNPEAWNIYGHNNLKVQVLSFGGKQLLVDKPELIFTPKDSKPSRVQIKAVNESETNYIAQLSIGGYPRVIAYAAPRKSIPNAESQVEQVAMATIEPQSIRVTASNRQDFSHSANVEQFHNNEYVIPMRDQFGLIDYTGLTFSAKVDVPSSDFRPSFQLLDALRSKPIAAPIEFNSDRQFEFGFEFQESIAIMATARDLKAEFSDTPLRGRLKLQTMIQSRNEPSPKPLGDPVILIFDSEKPEAGEVQVVGKTASSNGVRVTRGEKVRLRLKPIDTLSDIAIVRMAIDSPGKVPGQFDEDDNQEVLKGQRDEKTGEWEFVLDAETTAKSSLDRITVVTSSMDKAGNTQNSHPAVKIRLEQPVLKPKSDDEAK